MKMWKSIIIEIMYIIHKINLQILDKLKNQIRCGKIWLAISILYVIQYFDWLSDLCWLKKFEGLFYHIYQIWSKSEAILHLSYQLIITDYTKNEPCRNNHFFCNMCVFYARSLPENKRIRNRFSFIFCWWRITSIWGNQPLLLFVIEGQKTFQHIVAQWCLTL